MSKVIIEVSHPPFGHENAYSGLFVALGALPKGIEVVVIFTGDGVYTGRKGQVEPFKNISLPSTEEQISDILNIGGRVVADRQALLVRGIGTEELIEGIEILDTHDIQDIMLDQGEHVLVF